MSQYGCLEVGENGPGSSRKLEEQGGPYLAPHASPRLNITSHFFGLVVVSVANVSASSAVSIVCGYKTNEDTERNHKPNEDTERNHKPEP